jgi:hypothetical protein
MVTHVDFTTDFRRLIDRFGEENVKPVMLVGTGIEGAEKLSGPLTRAAIEIAK